MNSYHTPVLLNQVIEVLKPNSTKVYIDATLGNAGHSIKLLQAGATVFGIDLDPNNLNIATKRIKADGLNHNFIGINDNFNNIAAIHRQFIKKPVDGILFDLGLSQGQQKSQGRGFSFKDESSLDMRINPDKQTITASQIVNTYSQQQLFDIFSKLGQDKYSQQIASKIINTRKQQPIDTAKDLASLVKDVYQSQHHQGRLHPATKVFLTLKITVNQELFNLTKALEDSLNIVKPNGHMAIITFHSTEDRLVKNFIKTQLRKQTIYNPTKTKPSFDETKSNPLSRSALLRTFQIKWNPTLCPLLLSYSYKS